MHKNGKKLTNECLHHSTDIEAVVLCAYLRMGANCIMSTTTLRIHLHRGTGGKSALSASIRYHRRLNPVMVREGSSTKVMVRPQYQ